MGKMVVTHTHTLLLMAEILHQFRLVVYPIIYRVSAPSQVVVSQISAINSITGKSALCACALFFVGMVPYSPWL